MKKVKKSVLLLIVLAFAAAVMFIAPALKPQRAYAGFYDDPDYTDTYLYDYDVTCDIQTNRLIKMTEDITVHFYGKSGFLRDIPVNGGEQIKNITVKQFDGDTLTDVWYDVYSETDDSGNTFVTLDIGDRSIKNDNYKFRITYDYIIARVKSSEKNLLALTPIGAGWGCKIKDIDITMLVPDGYILGNKTECFIQRNDIFAESVDITQDIVNGKTALIAHVDGIDTNTAVRFDIEFNDGVLTKYSDFKPYIFVIILAVVAVVAVLLRLFVFNKSEITPVTNYEAPDGMDPLKMGKLIDNSVNNEDVTSMLYYFADKGYMKINFDDKDDPKFIRIVQELPETSTAYEREMFYKLFASGEVVSLSQLTNRFYVTSDKVTKMVNAQNNKLYKKSTRALAIGLSVLSGLLMALAPFIFVLVATNLKLIELLPLLSVICTLVLYFIAEYNKNNWLKNSTAKRLINALIYLGGCAVTVLLYIFFAPSWVMSIGARIAVALAGCVVPILSAPIVSRTDEYRAQLGDIIGFRDFILYAEKDKLETMLEDDPQYYYHVLPYAQVLGVSDKWEKRFDGLTVAPPAWMTSSTVGTVWEFHMWNSLLRTSTVRMSTTMKSRPSSSGASGGRGGSFGGHFGGGHGGGGGRFR